MQNRFKSGRSSDNDDEDESIVFTPKNDQDEKPGQDDNNQLSIQQQLKEAVDAQIADLDVSIRSFKIDQSPKYL